MVIIFWLVFCAFHVSQLNANNLLSKQQQSFFLFAKPQKAKTKQKMSSEQWEEKFFTRGEIEISVFHQKYPLRFLVSCQDSNLHCVIFFCHLIILSQITVIWLNYNINWNNFPVRLNKISFTRNNEQIVSSNFFKLVGCECNLSITKSCYERNSYYILIDGKLLQSCSISLVAVGILLHNEGTKSMMIMSNDDNIVDKKDTMKRVFWEGLMKDIFVI